MKIHRIINIVCAIALACTITWNYINPHYTYIEKVELDEYQEITMTSLKIFNKLSGNIFFRKGIRPIIIRFGDIDKDLMGISIANGRNCKIILSNSLRTYSFTSYMNTLLHELGHCYGLKDDYKDGTSIMFWQESSNIEPTSIFTHLERLKRVGQ